MPAKLCQLLCAFSFLALTSAGFQDDYILGLNMTDFNDMDVDGDHKVSKREASQFAKQAASDLFPEGVFPYLKKLDADLSL
mmetsp:Transcript_11503/g.12930  ORF Transcript_11503/g.12930 Transcript_11503/m.12930 type:complete len:81 (+) Transcript_11503:72-314(+)